MVLPDSDGTCCDLEHRGKQVLLVQQRRAAAPVPPGGQVQGLGSSEKEGVEGGRKGVRVEASTRRPLRSGTCLEDERATGAVQTFLRNTKAGCVVATTGHREVSRGIWANMLVAG